MKEEYVPEWALKGPIDLEYRHYSLLAEIKRLKKDLDEGQLASTLKQVDDTLDFLYRYDAERLLASEIQAEINFNPIDFSSFEIDYINSSSEQEQIMDVLCGEAINLFEDLHATIRNIWREIELGLKLTYVPNRKYLLNDGFVFIITADNKLHSYYFNKPSKYILDWRSFSLEYLSTCKYSKKKYMQHLDDIDAAETNKLIIKVDCINATQIESYAIEVIKCMIYTMLKKDYTF